MIAPAPYKSGLQDTSTQSRSQPEGLLKVGNWFQEASAIDGAEGTATSRLLVRALADARAKAL